MTGSIEGTERAKVAFSPHGKDTALLASIADDVREGTTSCLFYSLAFLHQTPGAMQDAIRAVTESPELFVYGISDRKVGGLDLQKPDGNVAPVFSAALAGDAVPQPFKAEPTGGGGNRMHHKFLVVDFDKPYFRVARNEGLRWTCTHTNGIPGDPDHPPKVCHAGCRSCGWSEATRTCTFNRGALAGGGGGPRVYQEGEPMPLVFGELADDDMCNMFGYFIQQKDLPTIGQ